MQKVVVIGSNSFSGSDFIDLLLEEKRFSVMGVSRSSEKKSCFLPYKKHGEVNFCFHQIDLNHDLDKFEKLLDDFQPEYIVNFAAQSEVGPSWANPTHWYQTNVVALTAFIDRIKDKPYLKRYVHISSPEVYGTCVGIVKEDAPLNPSTPYAASKAAADMSLFTYVKNFNFPLVMIRATNVYGAHQQLFKIIPRTILYLKSGKKIELHGGGRAVKSYIHIRDVSKGELAVMEKGKIGEIYHLSPSSGYAVRDIVSKICHAMDYSFEDAVINVEERLGQDAAYVIDSSKARQELGWSCGISIEEGLQDVVDWVDQYKEQLLQENLEYIHKE